MNTTRDLHTNGAYNRKPYRTKAQKEKARKDAVKDFDGAWRSNAPRSYHPVRADKRQSA